MWCAIAIRAVPLDKAVRNFADKARVLHRFTWAYQGVWSWDYSRLALMTRPALLLQPAEDTGRTFAGRRGAAARCDGAAAARP